MKNQSNNLTHKKEEVLYELEKTVGVVTIACKKAKISRFTFYDWKKKDPEFEARVVEIQNDFAVDYVESKLFKNIESGRETSIIFFLKTRGRHRGYGQEEQVRSQNTKPPVEWIDDDE